MTISQLLSILLARWKVIVAMIVIGGSIAAGNATARAGKRASRTVGRGFPAVVSGSCARRNPVVPRR